MDYEKKYKEALKKAEAFYNSATTEPITEREVLANIFPELTESKDERIRKRIYNYINVTLDDNESEEKERWLAWLEKQGDKPFDYENATIVQKDFAPIEQKFKVGDRVNKNDREDEEHCILTITSVNIDEHCYICDQCSVIDFGEQDLWHIVEQKPAWSEEDEEISKGILNYLCLHDACELEGFDEWYEWLKSIKYRVQSKQEWSKEDERMRQYVVSDLRFLNKLVHDPNYAINVQLIEKEIEWMESIKNLKKE